MSNGPGSADASNDAGAHRSGRPHGKEDCAAAAPAGGAAAGGAHRGRAAVGASGLLRGVEGEG